MAHPADPSEGAGARPVLAKARAAGRSLGEARVGGGSRAGVAAWAAAELGDDVEVARRPAGTQGFAVPPRRRAVERSFAWIGRYRRPSKEYEAPTETSEATIRAAFGATSLRRSARLKAS